MTNFLIKNKKFTHDEEITFGLNKLEEITLGITFFNRNLSFPLGCVLDVLESYKPSFFSTTIEKSIGLKFVFDKPKLDEPIDDASIEEVRRYAKLAYNLGSTEILYMYETGNWYFCNSLKETIDENTHEVLSVLVDKIIDICNEEIK